MEECPYYDASIISTGLNCVHVSCEVHYNIKVLKCHPGENAAIYCGAVIVRGDTLVCHSA